MTASSTEFEIGLTAAVVSVHKLEPAILTLSGGPYASLPSGPFTPLKHRTLDIGLRSWVSEQTALKLGYVEQLYTFGDRGRHARPGDETPHIMSIGYLALTKQTDESDLLLKNEGAQWLPWYQYFPWEDWRLSRPQILDAVILPALDTYLKALKANSTQDAWQKQQSRIDNAFGRKALPWDDEKVLERYEILYSAGLVEETIADGRVETPSEGLAPLGRPLQYDHRRILATAIARLRAKLKYRPVVFELMAETFTLTGLQHTVEAITGRRLHKQNFRRLVDSSALVEPTGTTTSETGGRPAALYRFRSEVVNERSAPGLRLGLTMPRERR
jgi:hypothetical protein